MTELIEMAGVVLENDRGELALQLRDTNPEIINPGLWSIFGGHVEAGETPAEAAVREMREELSVELDSQKLVLLGAHELKGRLFYVYYYRVTNELDQADLKEGRSWRWCSQAEILSGEIEGQPVVDYHIAFLQQFWTSRQS